MIECYLRLKVEQLKEKQLIWTILSFISMLPRLPFENLFCFFHDGIFNFHHHELLNVLTLSFISLLLSLLITFFSGSPLSVRCVRLARFENDRTISFIPPDGAFDLMTYRLSTQVHFTFY